MTMAADEYGFDESSGLTEWKCPGGTLLIALLSLQVKFLPKPRFTSLEMRRISMLSTKTQNSSLVTPESTPRKKPRLEVEDIDHL